MMEEKTAELKIFENSIGTTRKNLNAESQESKSLSLDKSFEHKEDELLVENDESQCNHLVKDYEKYALTEYFSLEDKLEVDFGNFWNPNVKWDTRKIIAENYIRKNKERYLVHFLAFEGETEKILDIFNSKENKDCCKFSGNELEKDSLGYTPIVYAIWGELNRNDEAKATSRALLLISFEIYNKFSIKSLDQYGYYQENNQRKKKHFTMIEN